MPYSCDLLFVGAFNRAVPGLARLLKQMLITFFLLDLELVYPGYLETLLLYQGKHSFNVNKLYFLYFLLQFYFCIFKIKSAAFGSLIHIVYDFYSSHNKYFFSGSGGIYHL